MPGDPRVLFLGMNSPLSVGVLRALLADGVTLCGVVLPAPAGLPGEPRVAVQRVMPSRRLQLPVVGQEGWLAGLAAEAGVPAYALGQAGHPEAVAVLRALAPDVGCVACFSRRLPPALLAVPAVGCLNLHPSLLPRFRGPDPLFWTFRAGLTHTGVTIHLMDEGLDTGPMLRQADLALPLGITRAEAERRIVALGGPLMAAAARAWVLGTLPAAPQPEGPPADPWPGPGDFTLSPDWSAARAFHFMRGTEEWERPYQVTIAGRVWRLSRALDWAPEVPDGAGMPVRDEVWLPFRDGALRARIA